jgi:hypothetical protein
MTLPLEVRVFLKVHPRRHYQHHHHHHHHHHHYQHQHHHHHHRHHRRRRVIATAWPGYRVTPARLLCKTGCYYFHFFRYVIYVTRT